MAKLGALPPDSRFRLTREGGLVAAPGLMRPREFAWGDCQPGRQQQRLAELVDVARERATARPGRGDQRFFRLELFAGDDLTTPTEQLTIDETDAPPRLVALWEHGIPSLDG
ncbi:protealysin inhibitor emfourin [Salinisphaera hydrothermalis]|uniref:protealysin inhibitor emfourin n=1 Tax=Salinisphaera hydrothermalis TaxID=563188 RepID=UPI00333FEA4D